MQTYTFTETELRELRQLLEDTIQLFSSKPHVYDFSGGKARAATIDEIINGLNDDSLAILFNGEPAPVPDTGNAEFDAAIEPAF